ncbi:Zn-dependent protease [Methylocella tundrae]|uniref:Zn-dependent protease n=2 Tax=Methylocella tundrae TaxID=227605 RepID=A0A8B6M5T9_METTU|nr:Zn-dependent protease [Methylocella tundrae]
MKLFADMAGMLRSMALSGRDLAGSLSRVTEPLTVKEGAAFRQGWAKLRSDEIARRFGVFCVLAAALALAACASIEPQGDQSFKMEAPPLPPHPPAPENKALAEHNRMVALFDGEYKDPAAERYLNEILAKLAKADDKPSEPYKVTILNSPIVNAFALPPRDLFITRGLLALANDASEVAAVMAHEIAHLTARHAVQREEEEKRAAVISQAATVIQNKQKGAEIEATARRTIATFSRQQELDADQIGIKAIARAGFDPYGASRFLSALGRSAAMRTSLIGQNASADKPDILATHPSTPERVTQAIAVARQIGAPGIGVTDRDSYLAAIDGMIFGDGPSEGVVRGRSFLQARLGFAFVAPEGFALENASKALLGVSGDGNEALRLDSVKAPPGMSLEAYMASDWIDGLMQSSIESVDVNGMPAVIASARAGDWNFRLAVIRFDPTQIYRLIFAMRAQTDANEKRFRGALNSFHRASPEEIREVRPMRISIVTATPGQTPGDLADKMATPDRKLEFFLLINGLEADATVAPGERYKIVVEQE